MGILPTSHQTAGTFSPMLSLDNSEHQMVRLLPNSDVLEKAKISCIETLLLKSQLRWAGHVTRMQDYRLPKIALYGELSSGHREVGAPKKRYKELSPNLQYRPP